MAAVDLSSTLQEPGRDSVQQRFWRRLIRHRLGMIGLVMLVMLVVSAVFAPLIAGIDPAVTDLRNKNEPPSAEHILGTDAIGRDVWARLVYGARVSLSVGLVAVGIYTSIALVLGSVSGFFGGFVDGVIMRFTDVIMCFPTFLLILTAVAVLPPNIFNIMVIIGIFGWPGMTRLIRGQFLSLRSQDFVTAAVATGVPTRRIIFRHILPNVVGPVVVAATLGPGRRHPDRVESQLSWPGRTAADAKLGTDPDQRAHASDPGKHALALAAFGDRDCLRRSVDELLRAMPCAMLSTRARTWTDISLTASCCSYIPTIPSAGF